MAYVQNKTNNKKSDEDKYQVPFYRKKWKTWLKTINVKTKQNNDFNGPNAQFSVNAKHGWIINAILGCMNNDSRFTPVQIRSAMLG